MSECESACVVCIHFVSGVPFARGKSEFNRALECLLDPRWGEGK